MNRTFLAAPLLIGLAGCATVVPPAAPSPSPAATAPAATTPGPAPARTITTAPAIPQDKICAAFTASLGLWQAAGNNGTASWATFRRFAKALRGETELAAGDVPLAPDLAAAARAVYDLGRALNAGGSPSTSGAADDLETVKIDCGQP